MLADKQGDQGPQAPATEQIQGYCAMCVSRCGSIAVVENGRFVALQPDPVAPHRQGAVRQGPRRAGTRLQLREAALPNETHQAKGRYRPWLAAHQLGRSAGYDRRKAEHDSRGTWPGKRSLLYLLPVYLSFIRLAHLDRAPDAAFGSPNQCGSMELCGWGRYGATSYTYGAGVPGNYMPDLEHAGCILFWGYNPNLARLAHAIATTSRRSSGARA